MNNMDLAEDSLKESLEIRIKNFGKSHLEVARA
jgi:hypothetical protein